MRLTKVCSIVVLCLSLALPAKAATPIYLPFIAVESLRICDPVELAKLDQASPPDYTSKEGCRVQGISLGFPTHMQDEVSAASPSDLLVPSRTAQHVLNCPTCTSANGITQIQGNISSQKVVIPSQLWNYYFWGNMLGVFDNRQTVTCQNGYVTYPAVKVGIGLGRATGGNSIVTDRRIYWELIVNNLCIAITDPYNASLVVTGASAPKFELYKSGVSGSNTLWTGRVWLGTWVYLFQNYDLPINGSANGALAGQVISAVNSDFSSITEYTNFVHKLELVPMDIAAYRSWHINVLPSRFVTTSYFPAPFNAMDLIPGDWTSYSTNINQP